MMFTAITPRSSRADQSAVRPQAPKTVIATHRSDPKAIELLHQILNFIGNGPAFDAKVRETVWASGREVMGVGTYEQTGGGSGQYVLKFQCWTVTENIVCNRSVMGNLPGHEPKLPAKSVCGASMWGGWKNGCEGPQMNRNCHPSESWGSGRDAQHAAKRLFRTNGYGSAKVGTDARTRTDARTDRRSETGPMRPGIA